MSKENQNKRYPETNEDKLRIELLNTKMSLSYLQRDYQELQDRYNSLMVKMMNLCEKEDLPYIFDSMLIESPDEGEDEN